MVNDYTENYKTGWVSLYRSIRSHWIWEDEKFLKWWLIMLFEANHKPNKITLGYEIYEVKIGESANSLRTWARLFNTTTKSVTNFLNLLEKDKMITRKTIGKGKRSTTLINITNYANYQRANETLTDTQVDTQVDTQGKRKGYTNNNDNNDNKEIRGKQHEFDLGDIISYFEDYSSMHQLDPNKVIEQVERAFEYYKDNEWKNSKGKLVKNLKTTIKNNWIKHSELKQQKTPGGLANPFTKKRTPLPHPFQDLLDDSQ